jgi:threonine aldolase
MTVDLRSDTVTRPTDAMRAAISGAEVGDDVFGDDPTVIELERETAALLGKEAALFVPSGTMANQLALSVIATPGTEVLLEAGAHIRQYESGAPAALWGITLNPVEGRRGILDPGQVTGALRPPNEHFAPLVAIALENTHNRAGGSVWPLDAWRAVCAAAREANLAVHLDGARLWNAAAASGRPVAELAEGADPVSVCFSKGLGAPVGSALASDRERIARARHNRKRLGGGMRQVGILAAGALYALRHHRERLVEDHARAARLAAALAAVDGVEVLPVETNIVIADVARTGRSQEELVAALEAEGVRAVGFGATRFRLVTHLDIDDAGVERAVAVLGRVLRGSR